jgi:signal transduction histidine kinase
MGFSVSQVVHGYGDICQVVTQLAVETHAPITGEEFQLFNRCLDDAIASAVTEFQRRRDESVAQQGTERLGVLAHEMRNRLSAAMLAFNLLKEGTVGIGGSTGTILGRNLVALRDLINNSLVGVRVEAGVGERTRIQVVELVREVEEEGALEAAATKSRLVVSPVEPGIEVEGDRQILAATLGNLLLNAFKFNRPSGQVSLRIIATAARVVIEVEDECGGLPVGRAEDLFLPFEQRGANRSGLGLGLAISRKAIEAMGGSLRVRDLPRQGCVFSIDLPRLPAA